MTTISEQNSQAFSLDATDLQILDQLQTDASLTNQQLAERVFTSPPTCLRRVKRLKEAGFIERQIAILNTDNADYRAAHGTIPDTSTIPVREALSWITTRGAKMLRMEERIGSLTPGKQADLVLIDATQLNMQPVHDPVAAVVMQTSLANIDSVMIAGQWKKRHGKLLHPDVPARQAELLASGKRMLAQLGLKHAA